MKTLGDKVEAKVLELARKRVEERISLAKESKPFQTAMIRTHDTMLAAREIAEAAFGSVWEAHVIEVYDRLVEEVSLAS